MMLIYFYQLLLFIEDPILLGGFKLGYKALDLPGVGAKCFGIGADEPWMTDRKSR